MSQQPEAGQPAFEEPWQAQAFAMVLALQDACVFSATEWADALGAEVADPSAAQDGHDYYEHWLAALEKVLARKGLTEAGEIASLAEAWQRAAHATPHGKPIVLENDPLRAKS